MVWQRQCFGVFRIRCYLIAAVGTTHASSLERLQVGPKYLWLMVWMPEQQPKSWSVVWRFATPGTTWNGTGPK